jgi:hypothetical protein
MKINLQITFDGGKSKEITANAADMVAFEDKFNVSVADLANQPRMSHLLFLAYHSEKRTGATKDSFEQWLETVDSVGGSDADPKSGG